MAIMDNLNRLLGGSKAGYMPLATDAEGKSALMSRVPKKPLVKLLSTLVVGFIMLGMFYLYAFANPSYAVTDANVVGAPGQVVAVPASTMKVDVGASVAAAEKATSASLPEAQPTHEAEADDTMKVGEKPTGEDETAEEDDPIEGDDPLTENQPGKENQPVEEEHQPPEEHQAEEENQSAEKLKQETGPAGTVESIESPSTDSSSAASAPSYDFSPGNKKLVVVVFASDPGPALCKVIMSAIVMGYSMPHIVNWGLHLEDVFPDYLLAKDAIGPHQLKIIGALDYLDEMSHPSTKEEDRLNDDDLVLMADAYDIWFQAPPEVLISRYHQANREANERLAAQWTGQGAAPMNQTIVFSSQKRCYPNRSTKYNMQCDHIPDSPLRKDLYGKDTDKDEGDFHNVRPKFINSGAIMGPVGDLKRYVRKSADRLGSKAVNVRGKGRLLPSDQGIFGEIWGEQEVYRTWLREQTTKQQFQPKDLFMMQRDYEFGVGLDYKQDICIATVFEEQDGEIFKLNDRSLINKKSEALGIEPRLKGVPDDLKRSRNPLDILDAPRAKNMTWSSLAMYADFFTESVPVMVHHNAWHGGLKNRNQEWWDKMWYFPYFRDLVTARLETFDASPLGSVRSSQRPVKGDGGGDDMITYYPLVSDRDTRLPRIYRPGQANTTGLDVGEWEDICYNRMDPLKHWSEEVFRDGKGGMKGEVAEPAGADDEIVSG